MDEPYEVVDIIVSQLSKAKAELSHYLMSELRANLETGEIHLGKGWADAALSTLIKEQTDE